MLALFMAAVAQDLATLNSFAVGGFCFIVWVSFFSNRRFDSVVYSLIIAFRLASSARSLGEKVNGGSCGGNHAFDGKKRALIVIERDVGLRKFIEPISLDAR